MERAPTHSLLCSSTFSYLWSCFFTGFWFSIHPMTANLSQSSPILQESSLPGSLRGHCCLSLHPRDSDLVGLGIGIFCFLDSPSDFLGAVKVESNSPRLFIHGVVASALWLHLILHLAQNTQFITSLSCPTSGHLPSDLEPTSQFIASWRSQYRRGWSHSPGLVLLHIHGLGSQRSPQRCLAVLPVYT